MFIIELMFMELSSNHAAVIVLFNWAHWTCSLVTLCLHGRGFPYRGDGSTMSVHANHAIMHTPGQSSDVTVVTTIDYYQIWLRKAMSIQAPPEWRNAKSHALHRQEYLLCLWGGSTALKIQRLKQWSEWEPILRKCSVTQAHWNLTAVYFILPSSSEIHALPAQYLILRSALLN